MKGCRQVHPPRFLRFKILGRRRTFYILFISCFYSVCHLIWRWQSPSTPFFHWRWWAHCFARWEMFLNGTVFGFCLLEKSSRNFADFLAVEYISSVSDHLDVFGVPLNVFRSPYLYQMIQKLLFPKFQVVLDVVFRSLRPGFLGQDGQRCFDLGIQWSDHSDPESTARRFMFHDASWWYNVLPFKAWWRFTTRKTVYCLTVLEYTNL